MESKSNHYKGGISFIVAGLIISLLFIIVFSHVITGISAGMTYDATLAVKKNMLRENVDNLIAYIDYSQKDYKEEYPNATDEETEQAMTELARKRIYSESHMDGCYMWIEKVLNYDGGDDYAIRVIHPNLTDTEGQFLTTNEVNSMGKRPYEEELAGIRENGEIYLTYEFKKLNSDEVTGKICYSKLYKDFDWIVCMGVNFDDLDHYEKQARESMRLYQIIIIFAIAGTWLFLICLISYGYRRSAIKVYQSRNQELKDKLNRDIVTGASSRDYGEQLLEEEYSAFRNGRADTLLLMMDVDHFKQFNDTYGHELGDKVLKAVVDAVRDVIGDMGTVIRWGGDEFLALIRNTPPDEQADIADKIINAVRNIKLETLGDKKITSSMGFAYFADADEDAKGILSRADDALYIAKENGRDNWQIVM